MAELNRQDTPPAPGPRAKIYRVKTTTRQIFQVLSPVWWGVYVHWNGKTTEECTGNSKVVCEGHKRGFPVKWRGYLHCLHLNNDGEPCFVEFTPDGAAQIEQQRTEGSTLRNYRIDVSRTSNSKGARYRCVLLEPIGNGANLPLAKDPETELRKLWQWGRALDSGTTPG